MTKAIIVADLHIKLGQKNVPAAWQVNRFNLLAESLLTIAKESGATRLIIAGDLLDVATPSISEVGLMYDFLRSLKSLKPVLIPGNHEMVTKTTDCYSSIHQMLLDLDVKVIHEFETYLGMDFIPYNILKQEKWPYPKSELAVTHVRGEIPPHVEPEIDLARFSEYRLVFAGDLHSCSNSQLNILYPGSPFSTSFHRTEPKGSNGVFVVDTETGIYDWKELYLPQLIKKTVTRKEDVVKTCFHHTIYELEGAFEDLKGVESSELLGKKITMGVSAPPTLDMSGDLAEELVEYLVEVKGITDPAPYVSKLKEIIPDES